MTPHHTHGMLLGKSKKASKAHSTHKRICHCTPQYMCGASCIRAGSRCSRTCAVCSKVVQCSGTLIGQNHVLTAGHCVVDTDTGDVVSGLQFWPAVNEPDEPFPPLNVSISRVATETSLNSVSLNYDFALLTLQDPAPAGTAELAIVAGTESEHYNVTTAGYPGIG